MTFARIIVGDAREALRKLDPGSVQTCVTSPPYWGLRDYGVEGQIGLEESPDAFALYWRVRHDADLASLAAVVRNEAVKAARAAGVDEDRIRMIDDAAREGAEGRAVA